MTQVDLREAKHNKPPENKVNISVGTLVMIKDKLKKMKQERLMW